MTEEIPRYVYVVGAVGVQAVKIGSASDCTARLSSMQTGCPLLLALLWQQAPQFVDALSMERSLHTHFAASRVRGEWFDLGINPVPLIRSAFDERNHGQPSLFERLEILSPRQEIIKEINWLMNSIFKNEEFIRGKILIKEMQQGEHVFDRPSERMAQDVASTIPLPIQQVVIDGKPVAGYYAQDLRDLFEKWKTGTNRYLRAPFEGIHRRK